ncbi:hypothetical protein [Bacillus pseudomycoides]|nr:hypothetical protein [Bacillus pseudomycoides]
MEKVKVESVVKEIGSNLDEIINAAQKGDLDSYDMLLKIKEAIGSI